MNTLPNVPTSNTHSSIMSVAKRSLSTTSGAIALIMALHTPIPTHAGPSSGNLATLPSGNLATLPSDNLATLNKKYGKYLDLVSIYKTIDIEELLADRDLLRDHINNDPELRKKLYGMAEKDKPLKEAIVKILNGGSLKFVDIHYVLSAITIANYRKHPGL